MDAASRDELVGRHSERSLLSRLVAQLQGGTGGIGWLRGEPGIGKSALVDVLAAEAAQAGCTVLRGHGDELAEAFPLRLMADALQVSVRSPDDARVRIAELLRGETAGTGAVDPVLAAGERMLELVDRLCGTGPVVLITEDLHWADEPSLRLWSRLARAVNQIPLLLVGTCRPVPRRERVLRLEELVAERGGTMLELGPLNDADVGRVAELVVGSPIGPVLRAELTRAGGNPLYVKELVDALVRDDLVDRPGGVSEVRPGAGTTPDSLTTAIGRRLRFLSAPTVRTLRLATMLGHEFDPGELRLVTRQPMTELLTMVDEAVAAGVLHNAGDRLAFRHELIRQVLQEQTPPAVRGGLRQQIAWQLAEAGAGMEVVGRHLLAVPGQPDRWVSVWLAGVPEPMLHVVPRMSVELLTRVVAMIDPYDPHRETLTARLARAQFWLGRDEEAARTAREVARRTANPQLAASMRLLALRSTGRLGRLREALQIGEDVVARQDVPLAWRARLGAWCAVILAQVAQTDRALAMAGDALRDAQSSGDPLAVGYARHALTLLHDSPSAVEHIEAALADLPDDPDSQDLRLMLLNNKLTYLTMFGQRSRARTTMQQALVLAERVGTFRAASLRATAAEAAYIHGDWSDAQVHLAGIDPEFMDQRSNLNARALSALIALHRGDRGEAEAHLRAVPVSPDDTEITANWRLSTAWALQAEAEGDLKRALGLLTPWLSPSPLPGQRFRHELLPDLVRLALAVEDTDTAQAAVAACQADADADPVLARLLAARCCQAVLDGDTAALLAVAEELRAGGWPLQVGFALQEAAVRLAEAGDTAQARAAFTDAVRIHTGLGATWDLRRTEARLRPYAIRRGPRSAHRRAATGWEALTPAEVRIANLVAQGMSNPDIATELFLARGTVQTHVSSILVKLGLRSRAGVIHEVARRTMAEAGAAVPGAAVSTDA